ncbi:retrovirus-related pol polyprotein from transposon TNT 1-94 [Tanacetum coccineum]
MQNREHGRMILESVENGLLIWPTVEENGVTKTKKYAELSAAEKIQADCDMKATNIILQGLPADIYSLVNHHRVAKDLWERVQLLMQGTSLTKQERECKMYDAFDKFTHIKRLHKYYLRFTQLINDLHTYLEQNELHANEVRILRERNQDPLAFVANHQTTPVLQIAYQSPQVSTQPMTESPLLDPGFAIPVFFPGDDPIACLNKAMAFLTTIASLRFPSTNNQLRTSSNPRNQATIQDGRVTVQQVQGRQGQCYSNTGYKSTATSSGGNNASRQAKVVKCYNCQGEGHMARQCTQLKRPRNATWVPDGQAAQTIIPYNTAFQTEDLDTYDFNCDDVSNAKVILMANISKYGSDVISEDFEQTPVVDVTYNEITSDSNIILNCEKMIDSQMDDMIKEKLALKEQVDSLEQNLSKQIKEKELGQSAQTVHMLTKPQAFYDNIHKQALGYQNPFYLKKSQRIKPTLYDGVVISDKHVAMHVIDDEETLILEEKSRSKMSKKEKDPEAAEQAFWLCMSNPTSKPSDADASLVKIKAPKELPKVSLVNESLKKLKFHLGRFNKVVKIRTTPDARTEGEWRFEHTKAIFNNEIIPFLKSLKYIFNVFDRDLLNEIMEVQTVFDQMDAAVQQSLVDKQCLEIG